MSTVKKKVFDLKQIIKDDGNDVIPRDENNLIELNLTFNIESIENAIKSYLDKGNPLDGSFFLWKYDISNIESSYSSSKGQIPMAEIINLYVDDEKEFVWAEIEAISDEFEKFKNKDNFSLSLKTRTNYNQQSIIVEGINGVIVVLDPRDEELTIGSEVLVIKRSHSAPGSGIGKGASFMKIEDIRVDDNDNIFYMVEGNWFGSDGLLVQGRGIRIKKINGKNLS